MWILGREPTMEPALMARLESLVREKIPSYDFDANAFLTRQGEDVCPYESRIPVKEWPSAE